MLVIAQTGRFQSKVDNQAFSVVLLADHAEHRCFEVRYSRKDQDFARRYFSTIEHAWREYAMRVESTISIFGPPEPIG